MALATATYNPFIYFDFNRREHEEKDIYSNIFIMICLPSLGMFFYKTDISAEKREIQTFPKVKENGKVNMDSLIS